MGWLIIFLLILLIIIGLPISFAILTSSLIAMYLSGIDVIMAPIQLFSGVNRFILLAIPLFIFMGELMNATSIAYRIINLARALVGWMKGGLAQVNVVTSMFMAEMSGSAVADAAIMSKIFVPSMVKQGYSKAFSAAVTATSATLGIIIPPSIPMVLYGVTTNTSISDLFLAGIIPGILLGLAFMLTNYFFSRKENFQSDKKFKISNLSEAFKESYIALIIPVVVVGGLIGGFVTATEAACLGVLASLFFGIFVFKDIKYKDLTKIVLTTVEQSSIVLMIIAASAVLGQFLANEQLPQQIASYISDISENYYIKLFLINIFLLLLGMFLHASAAIIVVVPILLPLVTQMGIDPVHFGVITCLNLGIGQQTPPVASVLLTVCATTSLKVEQIMKYAKWYILTMFIVLTIVTYIPSLSLFFK
jgi:C4-dicarboxylate transporter DctM subunit